MSDLIRREDVFKTLGITDKSTKYGGDHSGYNTLMLYEIMDAVDSIPNAETTGALDDAIQEYIKDGYILAEPNEYVKDGTLTVQMPTIKEAKAVDKIVVYADTYKQEYHMPREWEWCGTCKEYDQERHCCKRFIYVISHSVARLEEEYKPKVGKWLDGERVGYNGTYYYRYCSECLFERNDDDVDKDTPYCPNCGAKMERSE